MAVPSLARREVAIFALKLDHPEKREEHTTHTIFPTETFAVRARSWLGWVYGNRLLCLSLGLVGFGSCPLGAFYVRLLAAIYARLVGWMYPRLSF